MQNFFAQVGLLKKIMPVLMKNCVIFSSALCGTVYWTEKICLPKHVLYHRSYLEGCDSHGRKYGKPKA